MTKNNKDAQRGNTILLTIIGVATLLVALVGATFAYFSATVSNNSRESVNVTTQEPIALEYTGANLELLNALPGQSASNNFSVTNPSTSPSAQSYDLTFFIDSNNFETSQGDYLTIGIQGVSEMGMVAGPNTPSIIGDFASGAEKDYTDSATYGSNYSVKFVEDQRIEPEESHKYFVEINFHDKNESSNANANKSFTGHIDISDTKNVN